MSVPGTVRQMAAPSICTDYCYSTMSQSSAPSWTPKKSRLTLTALAGFVCLHFPAFFHGKIMSASFRGFAIGFCFIHLYMVVFTLLYVFCLSFFTAGKSVLQPLPPWCYPDIVGLLPPAGGPFPHLLPHVNHPCQCQVRNRSYTEMFSCKGNVHIDLSFDLPSERASLHKRETAKRT